MNGGNFTVISLSAVNPRTAVITQEMSKHVHKYHVVGKYGVVGGIGYVAPSTMW